MAGFTGGCLCGAIRYASTAEPVMQAVCHCRNCQKQAGSAFSIIVGVPEPALTIEGEPSTYPDRGISGGEVLRQFCSNCGSPVFTRAAAAPGIIFVKAGTFDDPEQFRPQIQFWTKTKSSWVDLAGVPAVEGNP